tara:strand:+ start:158 stop:724 length:567 start_codon:yes stop_codon:yes gene_type:complete
MKEAILIPLRKGAKRITCKDVANLPNAITGNSSLTAFMHPETGINYAILNAVIHSLSRDKGNGVFDLISLDVTLIESMEDTTEIEGGHVLVSVSADFIASMTEGQNFQLVTKMDGEGIFRSKVLYVPPSTEQKSEALVYKALGDADKKVVTAFKVANSHKNNIEALKAMELVMSENDITELSEVENYV